MPAHDWSNAVQVIVTMMALMHRLTVASTPVSGLLSLASCCANHCRLVQTTAMLHTHCKKERLFTNTVVTSISPGPATVQFLRQGQADAHLRQALQSDARLKQAL